MQSYGQFCPVAKAAEVFAERWTPLIVRELLCGSRRFSDLHRGVPLMSRSLLARRLRELERAGVIERRPLAKGRGAEYHLTPAGAEFQSVIQGLGEWGQRWARSRLESARDYDPGQLMWAMHRGIVVDRLPDRKIVALFEFRGVPPGPKRGQSTFWLVLERPEVEICLKDPGLGTDLTVDADLRTLAKVWTGDLPLSAAMRSGAIRLEGPEALRRAFPTWLALSPFAAVTRPRERGRASA